MVSSTLLEVKMENRSGNSRSVPEIRIEGATPHENHILENIFSPLYVPEAFDDFSEEIAYFMQQVSAMNERMNERTNERTNE